MTEPFKRLDEAMNRRRLQLRMNWRQLATAAGISYTGVRAIRRGEYRPTELTARALDDALRWMPGSVYAVLDGGEPHPIAAEVAPQPSSPPPKSALSPDEEALRRVVGAVARERGLTPDEVDEVMRRVRQDLEQARPPEAPPEAPPHHRAG